MMTRAEIEATRKELLDNCNGHPNALIAWPHRLLHKAADVCREALAATEECNLLRKDNDTLKNCAQTFAKRAIEPRKEKQKLQLEQNDLVYALEIIAGHRQCVDNLMGNTDIAEAALKKFKEG